MSAAILAASGDLSRVGFKSKIKFDEVLASAQDVGGFTVRQDYLSTIRNHIRRNTVFFPLLRKEPTLFELVKELREASHPEAGFFDKAKPSAPELPETPSDHPTSDVSTDPDRGQLVKAAGGVIATNHFGRSLLRMQGNNPYGVDQRVKKKNDLIVSTVKTIERACFRGDASANPLSFNGLGLQMAMGHSFVADTRLSHVVYKKVRSVVRLAVSDETIDREITHIFTSCLGLELIEEEMDAKLSNVNLDEVRPGLKVKALNTQGDVQGEPTPLIPSPYIRDRVNAEGEGEIDFWLVDMRTLSWRGVFPEGGMEGVYEPQVLEAVYYSDDSEYLVDKCICLIYGTLYAENRGQGIWRLTVKVPKSKIETI